MPEPTSTTSPAQVLAAVAAIGPFFAVRTDPPGPGGPRTDGYLPLAEAYGTGPGGAQAPAAEPGAGDLPGVVDVPGAADVPGAGDVPPGLRHRHATVAGRLGTDEARVVASLSFQGLAGRLWSLAVGSAVLAGQVPDFGPRRLWWHPERSAPDELWLPPTTDAVDRPTAPTSDPTALAAQLRSAVVDAHLTPLHRATTAASGVARTLLWGNAGSALAGALGVLDRWLRTPSAAPAALALRPQAPAEAAELARALSRELCATEPLRSTGDWLPGAGPVFRRSTCCLYYRVPGGGLCGDCVLPRVPGR
ncbi:(2Fe-2S)-binding protein [Streptomyces sp. HSW2009]|uniref:(2Fe-2S)-binding protein n=1 Tax=Streptomyces sp. HSW2009 TaxID=3142890 RepID=UPI0032EE441C